MMKQLILLAALLPAIADAQNYEYNFPTLTDDAGITGKYAPVSTPVCFGPDGTIYQSGLYDDMVMIGDDILEPVATSAYLSVVNTASKAPLWTIPIQGASRITAITTTANAIYIAGIFADDITLGSKDLHSQSYSGTSLSHEKVNGFVAKYSKDGNLLASESIIPHKIACYDDYESDLMVNPTSLAVYNGRLYIGLTFLGGYDIGSLSVDGNVKNSFGYWDSKCADVVAMSAEDLSVAECVYDIRNSSEVNTDGYAPSSICITASDDNLFIGTFTSVCTHEKMAGQINNEITASNDGGNYFFILHALDKNGNDTRKMMAVASERYYINNVIKKMTYTAGKLYLAGCVSTPLPMNPSLVPDLWCDQFASCMTAATLEPLWSVITAAKRDDMATTDEKYRETTDAALSEGKYTVVGATNFACDSNGVASDFTSEYCLGISDNGSALALTTKTDSGTRLSVKQHEISGMEEITLKEDCEETECVRYDILGRRIYTPQHGLPYIEKGRIHIAE